jgi:hypothetical protein
MSRKHFEALAAEIKTIPNMAARLYAAMAVCKAAGQFNDRFNQQRFLDACEV